MLSSRETENLFFSDRMQNKKEEMVTCSTTHTYIHTYRSEYIEGQATTIKIEIFMGVTLDVHNTLLIESKDEDRHVMGS
jgi:hypothetical protein